MSDKPDNATRQFHCSYKFDGFDWGISVWASTREEAEMKLRAIGAGKVDGVVGAIISADGMCPTCGRELPGE